MSKMKLIDTPADLRQIRALLSAGKMDADQALELLWQLSKSNA